MAELSTLRDEIARAIDNWRRLHPDVTVQEILHAIEEIRHKLTEALLKL